MNKWFDDLATPLPLLLMIGVTNDCWTSVDVIGVVTGCNDGTGDMTVGVSLTTDDIVVLGVDDDDIVEDIGDAILLSWWWWWGWGDGSLAPIICATNAAYAAWALVEEDDEGEGVDDNVWWLGDVTPLAVANIGIDIGIGIACDDDADGAGEESADNDNDNNGEGCIGDGNGEDSFIIWLWWPTCTIASWAIWASSDDDGTNLELLFAVLLSALRWWAAGVVADGASSVTLSS
jgi:hypothetical protein